MTGYRRADDGAEMVEVRPGSWVRRDVALKLGLAVPTVGATGRVASVATAVDPQPDPTAPPPLQPSHEDLVSIAPATSPAARRPRTRPAKRAITEILAEAARNQRARKVRA